MAACRIASDLDRLVWNHGGSGDDVEDLARETLRKVRLDGETNCT